MNTVVDTNVLLYHLAARLVAPLPATHLYASVVTEIELLSYPTLTASEERAIRMALDSLIVVSLTEEVKDRAIQLRRTNRLKLADSIVVATAAVLSATLLTHDASLLKLQGINASSPALTP